MSDDHACLCDPLIGHVATYEPIELEGSHLYQIDTPLRIHVDNVEQPDVFDQLYLFLRMEPGIGQVEAPGFAGSDYAVRFRVSPSAKPGRLLDALLKELQIIAGCDKLQWSDECVRLFGPARGGTAGFRTAADVDSMSNQPTRSTGLDRFETLSKAIGTPAAVCALGGRSLGDPYRWMQQGPPLDYDKRIDIVEAVNDVLLSVNRSVNLRTWWARWDLSTYQHCARLNRSDLLQELLSDVTAEEGLNANTRWKPATDGPMLHDVMQTVHEAARALYPEIKTSLEAYPPPERIPEPSTLWEGREIEPQDHPWADEITITPAAPPRRSAWDGLTGGMA